MDQCKEWQGQCNSNGYGIFQVNGKKYRAHRISWQLEHGPIPRGMKILHECDNPPCVKLTHLFLGTQADNVRDATNKGRMAKGYQTGKSKVTEDQVREIRSLEGTNQYELAKRFNITQPTISNIMNRRTWRHI